MMRKRGNAPEKHEKELYLIMMYPNATHGLERVYQSQVIALVAAVLMIIPVINILAAIALIVSLVLYMIGINEAGKDDESYKTAFTLIIVQLVISVLNSLIGGVIFDLVNEALALAVLYFVCITTNKLLKNIGADGRITDRGVVVWKINVICTIVEVVCTLLALIPSASLQLLAAVVTLVTAIAQIVGSILYILYLRDATTALKSIGEPAADVYVGPEL